MKIGIIVAAVIIVFGGGIYLANNSSGTDSDQASRSEQTAQLVEGTVIYDVRTPEEFAASHAVGAINWPIETIQAGQYPDVEKDTPIAVYCRSGNRSGQATAILEQAGYTNITDIGAFTELSSYGIATT